MVSALLLFSRCNAAGGDDGDDLAQWFKNVNDPAFACDKLGVEAEEAEEVLFRVVDCGEEGARWDYKYQVSAKVLCKLRSSS